MEDTEMEVAAFGNCVQSAGGMLLTAESWQ
jgi:hypothetical protein